jgi:Flp pilus assembly protein CpaB
MARSELGIVTAVTGGRAAVADREATEPGRVIQRRAGLPEGRAVLGALLMAIAAVGVFLASTDASEGPSDELVVASTAIRPGEQIAADDLRLLEAELPGSARGATFATIDEVVGRVALGPIDAGEIVQAGSLTSERATTPAHEVALTLPRGQVAVGRLKEGERVDVFVTYEERTTSVVRGAEVVQIATASDGSLTSDREIGIVVAVPSGEAVAALVHALRTGDVTVVRSTFASPDEGAPLVYDSGDEAGAPGTTDTGSAGD